MVEVFKTNVQCRDEAALLIKKLLAHLPLCKINFDLEDCDRILRIEGNVLCQQVIALLGESGYSCEVLA